MRMAHAKTQRRKERQKYRNDGFYDKISVYRCASVVNLPSLREICIDKDLLHYSVLSVFCLVFLRGYWDQPVIG